MTSVPHSSARISERALFAIISAHFVYVVEQRSFPLRGACLAALAFASCCALSQTLTYLAHKFRLSAVANILSRALNASSRLIEPRKWWVGCCWTLFFFYAYQATQQRWLLPNHHYLLMYTALAAALSFGATHSVAECWRTNARWLLVGCMGVAALQKLTSASFVSGDYFGFMLARGSFFPFIAQRFVAAGANQQLIDQFMQTAPSALGAVQLSTSPALALAARALTWGTLAAEIWLTASMALRPSALVTQYSWLAFLVVLGALRQELVFLCTLVAIALGTVHPLARSERKLWSLLLALMAPQALWRAVF